MSISVITRMKVKKGKTKNFKNALSAFLNKTKDEKGCEDYNIYQNRVDEDYFIFNEVWKDQDAINFHLKTEHFKTFMGNAMESLENLNKSGDNPFQVTIASLFDPANPPKSDVIIVASKMKSKDNVENTINKTLAMIIKPSNNETGCLGYDLYQNIDDKKFFILFEQWKGFGAIDEHMKTKHFGEFMNNAPEFLVPYMPSKNDLFEVMICTPFAS